MRKTVFLARLVVLTALTLAVELIGLPQPVTGPLVNLMLFLTAMVLNPLSAMALGCLTPVIAVIRGQLPAILLPMVPFIIIGNALLILGFSFTKQALEGIFRIRPPKTKSIPHWVGIIAGSTSKFLWLYASASFVLPVIFGKNLPANFIATMALPQLVTALIGGMLSILIYTMLSARYFHSHHS